jgi:outer membrane protein insertion porin family
MKKQILRALLALVLAAPPALAAELPVVRGLAVQNRGPLPIQQNQILAYVSDDYVGRPLDHARISRDVRELLATRLYSYVGTVADPLPDGGVRLIFVVEARYRLDAPLDVHGQSKLSRGRIRKAAGLKAGDPIDEAILQAAAVKVRAEYVARRYQDARVTATLLPVEGSPGAAFARLDIVEGERVQIPLIQFDGNSALSDRALRRHTNQAPWWDPYTHFFKDKHLDPYDLQIVRADARAQYADLGYLDAAVSDPIVAETNGVRRIRYTVTEGLKYHVGDVTIEGVRLFPEATVRAAAGIRGGDVAAQCDIDAASKAIRDFYGARGYVDTTVRTTVSPDTDKPGVVNLRYAVHEGALLHVRSVQIRGNTTTKDKVLRREITLDPGGVYNDVAADRGERRLSNLGYFESVRHYDLETDDPAFRDVVYEVDEKSTGQLMVGAGYSSVDHLIGFLEISESNFDIGNWGSFRGGGQKARFGLQASGDYTDAEISFTEPWFLDHYVSRLALDADAFLRTHQYNEYDERRYGGSVGVSRHVPWVGRLGLSLQAEKVELDDILKGDYHYLDEPDHLYRFTDELDDYFLGSMRLHWLFDTRDRAFVPTSGVRASSSATYYGEALGSDVDMYALEFQYRHYIPVIYTHVLSFQLRANVIDTFDDDDTVPISSRYFLGGGRNVRGFRNRAIGPKVVPAEGNLDGARYRSVGGQSRVQASVEYSIPLSKFFRLGVFYDIGNVWEDPYDFDFSEYASSVGGGIRLDIPGFPIRFDYAYPLEKDDDCTRTQRFVFWVGFD